MTTPSALPTTSREDHQSLPVPADEVTLGSDVIVHPTANLYRCRIGDSSRIAAFVEIGGSVVGARCKIQAHAFIPPGVFLADEVFVGPGVTFTNDRYPQAVGPWTRLETHVAEGASIGAGAVILPGLTIGAHARIGAGSVVVDDVPAGACVVGNPARGLSVQVADTFQGDCLIILNPRAIPAALASLSALPIDKVWLTAFTEEQLVPQIRRIIERTCYRDYLIVSDDVLVPPQSLVCVREMLRRHPAVTGYCRLAANSDQSNLTKTPMRYRNGSHACWEDYAFYSLDEVQRSCGEFTSWLGGWSLTGMRRELWLTYPFEVNSHTQRQSDAQTALRMNADGRAFFTHSDAYIEHLKPDPEQACVEGWLVGNTPPIVRWEFSRCHEQT